MGAAAHEVAHLRGPLVLVFGGLLSPAFEEEDQATDQRGEGEDAYYDARGDARDAGVAAFVHWSGYGGCAGLLGGGLGYDDGGAGCYACDYNGCRGGW